MRMVMTLPGFGTWVEAFANHVTPNPHVGYRSLAILFLLRLKDPEGRFMTSSDLAEYYVVRPSVITVAINTLVEEGYLERRSDARDRRRYHFVVTEEGRKISEEVEQRFLDEVRATLGDLDEDRVKELMRSLESIQEITAELNRKRRPSKAQASS